jgi:hypothetical protein
MTAHVVSALSGPAGALLVAGGAALVGRLGRLRRGLFPVGALLLLTWLVRGAGSSPEPVAFGMAGGLIVVSFLWSAFRWSRARPGLSGPAGTAADLRLVSYVLFFVGAWALCGWLGGPPAADPRHLQGSGNPLAATGAALRILTCLALGWVSVAASHSVEARAPEQPAKGTTARTAKPARPPLGRELLFMRPRPRIRTPPDHRGDLVG